MPLCEPSQKGFSCEWPQPQNFGFSIVSMTLPSESTMSTVPVKRIDPLFGFTKTLGLVKVVAKNLAT